jgi:hypothetical protein
VDCACAIAATTTQASVVDMTFRVRVAFIITPVFSYLKFSAQEHAMLITSTPQLPQLT